MFGGFSPRKLTAFYWGSHVGPDRRCFGLFPQAWNVPTMLWNVIVRDRLTFQVRKYLLNRLNTQKTLFNERKTEKKCYIRFRTLIKKLGHFWRQGRGACMLLSRPGSRNELMFLVELNETQLCRRFSTVFETKRDAIYFQIEQIF